MKRPNLLAGTICVEMVDLLSLLKRFGYIIYCKIYIFQKMYCNVSNYKNSALKHIAVDSVLFFMF